MAPPPNKPHQPLGLAARVNDCFPARSTDLLMAAARRRVRTHAAGQVVVVHVDGPLSEIVAELGHEIRLVLAEAPRGVVCDLTAVTDEDAPGAMGVLAAVGRHVRDWPGIPVAVACPDERVRDSLRTKPLSEHLLVTGSVRLALSEILQQRTPVVASVRLTPHPTAPRAARDLVTRTLPDWQLSHRIPSACLLVSELVTNSIVHAGTNIDVSIALHLQDIRVTVRDHSPGLPLPRGADPDMTSHGLALIAELSRAWGVLPATDNGKVVWAVLDVHRDLATNSHDRAPGS